MKINSKKLKIGILGDLIIDKYKYYKAIRLSPEGPAPIVKSISEDVNLGGAGNVAISLANLGLEVELYYAKSTKDREESINFIKLISNENNITLKKLNSDFQNTIPIKIRYYVDGKQFMREDLEKINNSYLEDIIPMENLKEFIDKYDVLVISDYQKGLISTKLMQMIIKNCNFNKVPLFIDTKNTDLKSIEGAFCLKINESEFNKLFKEYSIDYEDSIEQIKVKINNARKLSNICNLILTLGSKGSILSNSFQIVNVKSEAVDVVDITGAGDAFLAGIAYSYAQRDKLDKFDLKEKFLNKIDLEFANKAAESVIAFKGTKPISKNFLTSYDLKKFKAKKIGFTNGCFDLLHLGHLSLLKHAKENCEYLIVGLNSDKSIRKLKGKKRPINDEETRFQILKSIKYVDEVIIFDDETPINLIKEISPYLLIKGSDYKEKDIVGADYVKSNGGKILISKIVEGKSSTSLIDKIENIKKEI